MLNFTTSFIFILKVSVRYLILVQSFYRGEVLETFRNIEFFRKIWRGLRKGQNNTSRETFWNTQKMRKSLNPKIDSLNQCFFRLFDRKRFRVELLNLFGQNTNEQLNFMVWLKIHFSRIFTSGDWHWKHRLFWTSFFSGGFGRRLFFCFFIDFFLL